MTAKAHLAPGRVRVGDMLTLLASGNESPKLGNESRRAQPNPVQSSRDSGPISLDEAHEQAKQATFCLCPSGDAPALTQRFYQSIFAGCIPVFIDLCKQVRVRYGR